MFSRVYSLYVFRHLVYRQWPQVEVWIEFDMKLGCWSSFSTRKLEGRQTSWLARRVFLYFHPTPLEYWYTAEGERRRLFCFVWINETGERWNYYYIKVLIVLYRIYRIFHMAGICFSFGGYISWCTLFFFFSKKKMKKKTGEKSTLIK